MFDMLRRPAWVVEGAFSVWPTPERLTSLGPSHAAELLRCGYRVAWIGTRALAAPPRT